MVGYNLISPHLATHETIIAIIIIMHAAHFLAHGGRGTALWKINTHMVWLQVKIEPHLLLPDPEPLPLWSGQDACSEGKLSQSGRSTPNVRAVAHSILHALSLTSSHCPEVGWRETPELSHNPNRCRHRNGVTASLHSSLGLKLGMRPLAIDSSTRSTRGILSESQFMEKSMLSSSVWQIPPGVGYGKAEEHLRLVFDGP